MFKSLKLSYFGTLALAGLFLAFFPAIALMAIIIYVAVDFFYLSKRLPTVSLEREKLQMDLDDSRVYTLIGLFIMTPFNSLLFGAIGGLMVVYWVWRAYTAIRDYEAAEAAFSANDSDDNDDGDDTSAAP